MALTQGTVDMAKGRSAEFEREYNKAMTDWTTDLQTRPDRAYASKQSVDRALSSWKQNMYELMDSTQTMTSDTGAVEKLSQLASELGATKAELSALESKSVTRANQADSVNPKITQSPYTNLLGLRRMFRSSTRWAILFASILFGVLAVFALALLGYQMYATGSVLNPSFITGSQQSGGARNSGDARNFDTTR